MSMSLPMLSNASVVPLYQVGNQLGEGAFWDNEGQRLLWVDILEARLFAQHGDGFERFELPVMPSVIWKIENDCVYVATEEGVGEVALSTGRYRTVLEVEAQKKDTRSNDGGAAPDGSFWFGTMLHEPVEKGGAIYRIYPDLSVERIGSPVGIPNTFLFPPGTGYALIGDTFERRIYRYSLHPKKKPELLGVWMEKQKGDAGSPDGSALVDDVAVVNAEWGGSRLVAYDLDGREYDSLALPVSQPTSCVLGGRHGRTLFVTSAREGLSDAELAHEPDAGSVFTVELASP